LDHPENTGSCDDLISFTQPWEIGLPISTLAFARLT